MGLGLMGLISMHAIGALHPASLRCEYQPNPLGLDVARPRLYWTVESKRRAERQSAYQIVVASSPEALRVDHGDLWDSGKVPSEDTTHVEYKGPPLHSGQRVWWKVRVWDKVGQESAFSKPAWWEMALLAPTDWKAQWISINTQTEQSEDWKGVKWIWYPEGDPVHEAPAGNRYFAQTISVRPNVAIKQAEFVGIVDNAFELRVNGKQVGTGAGWQSPAHLDIKGALKPGANTLLITANNTDGPAGLAGYIHIVYADGQTLRLPTNATWDSTQVAPKPQLTADTVPLKALEIANIGDAPWGNPGKTRGPRPAPYLRKTFLLDKPVRSARVYASAQGLYKLYVNGKRVSQDVFRPGWTDYNKRIQYQTYDVTNTLKNGSNALGVVLGDGWYCGHVGLTGGENYGDHPRALVQMQVTYTDGSTNTVLSDGSWKGSTGPIQSDDLLMGETYDARKEIPGWDAPGFDDAKWQPVQAGGILDRNTYEATLNIPPGSFSSVTPIGGARPTQTSMMPIPPPPVPVLVAQYAPSVEKVEELKPRTLTAKPNKAYIFDLGQNLVGWAKVRLRGKPGDTVRLRFAEMLNPDGTIYTTNLRGAKATDYYTFKSSGTEVYEPSFTFHGFRYVELTGLEAPPSLKDVTGVVITSACPPTGTFECSSPLVNQLQHNILWGQHGNYLEVPTDCPQRDERLGWMGDAQIFIRTACFNNDVAAFMTKWTQDVVDAQSPEGGFSDVTPRMGDPADGAPAWGDAGVIVPWTIYACYGDTRLIEQRYPAMQKWIAYIRSVNPDFIWRKRVNNNFGDWLNTGSDTPHEVLSTAYYAYSTRLLSKMARAIGKDDDAKTYEELFQQIKAAFNTAFVAPDARIKGDTQTAYVLALRFDLLPDALRTAAADHLVQDILYKRNGHLSTGFLGVGYLTPTLTQTGHLDVAYRLLNNDTYPSWGYSIRHGATTIWERWDGWTEEKGFQDPGMNSFNHYSLGSVGEWMYASVAGIDLDPAQPAYKHILLHPHPGGGLTYARARYDSIHGVIVSDWETGDDVFRYDIEVPANTTATVYVLAEAGAEVWENGKPANRAEGVKFLRMEAGCAVYEVGSGIYRFTASTNAAQMSRR